jgi:hypothetical protein
MFRLKLIYRNFNRNFLLKRNERFERIRSVKLLYSYNLNPAYFILFNKNRQFCFERFERFSNT